MSAEGPATAIPDGTREGVDVPTRSARAPAASWTFAHAWMRRDGGPRAL